MQSSGGATATASTSSVSLGNIARLNMTSSSGAPSQQGLTFSHRPALLTVQEQQSQSMGGEPTSPDDEQQQPLITQFFPGESPLGLDASATRVPVVLTLSATSPPSPASRRQRVLVRLSAESHRPVLCESSCGRCRLGASSSSS